MSRYFKTNRTLAVFQLCYTNTLTKTFPLGAPIYCPLGGGCSLLSPRRRLLIGRRVGRNRLRTEPTLLTINFMFPIYVPTFTRVVLFPPWFTFIIRECSDCMLVCAAVIQDPNPEWFISAHAVGLPTSKGTDSNNSAANERHWSVLRGNVAWKRHGVELAHVERHRV